MLLLLIASETELAVVDGAGDDGADDEDEDDEDDEDEDADDEEDDDSVATLAFGTSASAIVD